MKPASYESYSFRQASSLSVGQLSEPGPRPPKGQPCSDIVYLTVDRMR